VVPLGAGIFGLGLSSISWLTPSRSNSAPSPEKPGRFKENCGKDHVEWQFKSGLDVHQVARHGWWIHNIWHVRGRRTINDSFGPVEWAQKQVTMTTDHEPAELSTEHKCTARRNRLILLAVALGMGAVAAISWFYYAAAPGETYEAVMVNQLETCSPNFPASVTYIVSLK